IANVLGEVCDAFLASSNTSLGFSWLYALCFTLHIYFDFSAYSDMAIGMGRIIGFHYLENFNYPYIASTVTDFWRRWHISLSSFFRDYVYIPLGGSRCKKSRIILNRLVVWACTGFWHGASWNYVLWGLYYFLLLALEKFVCPRFFQKLPKALSHVYLLLAVNFGWMLFRCEDLSWLGVQLRGIFCLNGNTFSDYETLTTLKANVFFLAAAILACTPLVKRLGEKLHALGETSCTAATLTSLGESLVPVLTVLLATAVLVGESYNPFLYFRF
ncbi:MAG: MBOAT family protein, partial [Oscillospiraceae bacterium]|nr:MBOAT family protein [Oscillospiraceae bacterium]